LGLNSKPTNLGNYYGYLSLIKKDEKYYLSLDDHSSTNYSEIDQVTYENLLTFLKKMINAQVKIITDEESATSLEIKINNFLKTIDVRQIIKTEYSSSISTGSYQTKRLFSTTIYYLNYEDIRDVKLDNVLEVK
jgi:hypothetical protein